MMADEPKQNLSGIFSAGSMTREKLDKFHAAVEAEVRFAVKEGRFRSLGTRHDFAFVDEPQRVLIAYDHEGRLHISSEGIPVVEEALARAKAAVATLARNDLEGFTNDDFDLFAEKAAARIIHQLAIGEFADVPDSASRLERARPTIHEIVRRAIANSLPV